MKVTLEVFTNDPASIATASSVLALLAGGTAVAAVPTQAAPAAPSAPTPPASPVPPVAAAAVPVPVPAPVAPTAAASPSNPAPAPAAPPPPAAGGISAAQFGAQVQAFAKHYSAKACKARFTELSAAFGQPWDKTSAVPVERYAEVMPWFAVAA